MSKQDFEAFLQRHEASVDEESRTDWHKRKSEWLAHIAEFYDRVQGWLQDFIAQRKVAISDYPLELNEDFIGHYETRKLILQIANQEVVFRPAGTLLIACRGRIDMEGPAGTVRFVLVEKEAAGVQDAKTPAEGTAPEEEPHSLSSVFWSWKIATPPPSMNYVQLDEESFFDALMEVMNG